MSLVNADAHKLMGYITFSLIIKLILGNITNITRQHGNIDDFSKFMTGRLSSRKISKRLEYNQYFYIQ